ncbi:uncharacterized protein PRCAT00000846001 [Priceomyces carsonii]|uniref:uncharacterized protein n=1 Tax=Priceomyces carsonii TaxID=28549 RepID=UPI002ED942B3|nr:unnamed protein product [Priceomyces carsonii]
MVVLNSNPEILLKKRKDKDRKRIEKQDEAKRKQLERKKRNDKRGKKFLRAETLVSNHISSELEKKRIEHITKYENQHRDGGLSEREEDPKLLFLIRVPDHTKGLKIPSKAAKVLKLLRLTTPNTGVFVKLTPGSSLLLKLISPYVVTGSPSLSSVRKLFQKRASITTVDEETKLPKTVKLDNNQIVEDKFGDDLGFVCIEDLIHEIVTLGENFKPITFWINPFQLNPPVNGWGPQSKLAKIQYEEDHKKKVSLAGNAKVDEIDIDNFIDEHN